MANKPLPTKAQRAIRALRNAETRARKHRQNGDLEKAIAALRSGSHTARQWLDGTHPQSHLSS